MRIKFYSTLIFLTLSHYVHASTTINESERSAISYLTTHNSARSYSYMRYPGEIESYKTPTVQINDFLSDKKRVDTKTHASNQTKETIIELAISEKITHHGSTACYMLSDRLKERNLLSLDPHDPCYGHFQALLLIDQISVQLVTRVFLDHFDIDAAVEGIDANMLREIGQLSRITPTMFKNAFSAAYTTHQAGIEKHIALLNGILVGTGFNSSKAEICTTDSSMSESTMMNVFFC